MQDGLESRWDRIRYLETTETSGSRVQGSTLRSAFRNG